MEGADQFMESITKIQEATDRSISSDEIQHEVKKAHIENARQNKAGMKKDKSMPIEQNKLKKQLKLMRKQTSLL